MSNPNNTSEIINRFEKSQHDLVLQTSDFSLQGLREMVENQIIDLSPKYQRRERWETPRQSELIESFLLNVPVPPVYLSEEEYGAYSIIDGKQRIMAVSDFLSNKYKLSRLSSFPNINGLRFRQLPTQLQNTLRVRPFLRVITLLKQSDPLLKYQVFLRLNRGGVRLNNQEIRNVAFRGNLNDAIYKAATCDFLRQSLNISNEKSKAYQQMLDAELVLRFLTLRDNWRDFSGSFSRSMDQFMSKNSDLSSTKADELVLRFNTAITRVEDLWGKYAFRRWDGLQWRGQALAGLYDAQMIACDQISEDQFKKLMIVRKRVVEATRKLFEDGEFEEAVRLGTNTPSRMTYRVQSTLSSLGDLVAKS